MWPATQTSRIFQLSETEILKSLIISACIRDEYPHCTFERCKPKKAKRNLNGQMVLLREIVIQISDEKVVAIRRLQKIRIFCQPLISRHISYFLKMQKIKMRTKHPIIPLKFEHHLASTIADIETAARSHFSLCWPRGVVLDHSSYPWGGQRATPKLRWPPLGQRVVRGHP